MKNLKLFLIIFLSIFFLVSCEESNIDEEIGTSFELGITEFKDGEGEKKITHHYNYYGEEFEITYVFNLETNEMVSVNGDVEIAEEILGQESETQAILYEYEGAEDPDFIKMKIFDSREELLEESKSNTKSSLKGESYSKGCYDIDSYGYADYLFYEGIGTSGNLLIHGSKKNEYSIQYLGNNNDKISSLVGQCILKLNMEITLFEDSCRSGKSLTFTKTSSIASMSIYDLRSYTLHGWWFWKTSWNDQVSSFYANVYQ